METALLDRLHIREVVQNWALWRDAGDWERFRSVWHPEARMMATWFQGPAERFIEVSREGWDKGVSILHFLGGSAIDVAGPRAIAQTKMTISQRATVDDVVCDVVCTGRFYDFFERRGEAWGIVLRQPIYEKDRLDPVDPFCDVEARPRVAGPVSGGLSPPRLRANQDRLHRQARHADLERRGGRAPVRCRRGVARRQGARLVVDDGQIRYLSCTSGGKSVSAVNSRRQTPCSNAYCRKASTVVRLASMP